MSNKKTPKNPELRFKKEDGSAYADYVPQKLSEVADRVTRKNKGNVSDIPLTISSLDGLIDQREYFNKTIASANMEGYYLLQRGEFAYNKSYSGGYSFGSIKRLDRYDQGALSTLYICFSLHDEVDSDYMVVYFDSQRWNKEVSIRCAEGARNHGLLNIAASDFLDISMNLPADSDEQQRIASLFAQLDALVSATQDEINGLKELKRTLLKQVFDQTVRFTKEDGAEYPEWESKKLRELSSYVRKMNNGDKVTYVGTENLLQNCMGVVFATQHEGIRGVAYQAGDILVGNIRPYLQKAWLADCSGVCSSDVLCIRSNGTVSAEFLYRMIAQDNFFQYVMSAAKGSKMPRGDKEHIMDMKVSCPVDPEEQARIATLFESLDEAIHEAEKERTRYQELKKGLMQRMFV